MNETMQSIITAAQDFVWGPVTLFLLVGTGVYLTLRLFFLQIRFLPVALKWAFFPHRDAKNAEGDISHFASLMTALSATIGTGNIAGVATAMVAGGPGALFWMWLSAFFGMATKYAEAILAVKYRVTNDKGEQAGGPMYYIERGLKMRWLAVTFAVLAAVASFGIGCSVQSNSVAQAVEANFGVAPWVTGVFLTVLTGVVVIGGIRSISRVAELIVPVMAMVYVIGGLVVILMRAELIGQAFELIFSQAFTAQSVTGAALGKIIQYGVARGVFSNEAGMGSAPIAAAAAKTDHPARQAFVSMTGTFLDTIVVCTITGLVITIGYIMAGGSYSGLNGAALTSAYFDKLFPGTGGFIVTFGLIFFAYSTILGWCYYGEKCVEYLFGSKMLLPYRLMYVLFVLLGALAHLDLVWQLADIFNGLMGIPNLIGLLLLSNVVVKETKEFVVRRKEGQYY